MLTFFSLSHYGRSTIRELMPCPFWFSSRLGSKIFQGRKVWSWHEKIFIISSRHTVSVAQFAEVIKYVYFENADNFIKKGMWCLSAV